MRRLNDRVPAVQFELPHNIEQHHVALLTPRPVIDEDDTEL
jgi:hypothetical protein